MIETNDISFYKDFIEINSDTSGLLIGNKLSENIGVNIDDELLLISIDQFLPITKKFTSFRYFLNPVYKFMTPTLYFMKTQKQTQKSFNYTGIFLDNPKKSKKNQRQILK